MYYSSPDQLLKTPPAPDGQAHAALFSWRERATQAYISNRLERDMELRGDLARRVKMLTGYRPAPDKIFVDADNRTASLSMDKTLFRLEQGSLIIFRPCAYCGTGQFKSLPITTAEDLGYAVTVWQPLHPDCVQNDESGEISL